jgi:flagellar L-ring protein precursor FlgH
MKIITCFRCYTLAAIAATAFMVGCANTGAPNLPQATFTPVQPLQSITPKPSTGAIYNGRQSDNWFGRGRNFEVGDMVTVILDESTQAKRASTTAVSRNSTIDILSTSALVKPRSGVLGAIKLDGMSTDSQGTGAADQQASLTGSLAVSIIEVMTNGNLVVRGEKQLSLSEGSEIIQISGVIRPEDISPNNTVLSRRLAHAQISYRGSGDLAAAAKPGWATQWINRFWPF